MSAEDHIHTMNQIPPPSKVEKRRKALTSFLLAFMVIVSFLFFVYGDIQKLEADRQREIIVKVQLEAENNFKEAAKQRAMALYYQNEVEKQKALAAEALAACEKNKKK